MRVMLTGDVVGRPGRRAFQKYTPKLREEKKIDIVIVNGENSAGGKGFTRKSLDELYHAGADVITSGNHVWDKKDVLEFIDQEPFLIRPANYPEGAPGKGWCIYPFKAWNIGVFNLSGRAFMPDMDCPFQKAEEILREIRSECDSRGDHLRKDGHGLVSGWARQRRRRNAHAYSDRGCPHPSGRNRIHYRPRHGRAVELGTWCQTGDHHPEIYNGHALPV